MATKTGTSEFSSLKNYSARLELGTVETLRSLSSAPLFFSPQLIANVSMAENAFARYDEHLTESPYRNCVTRLMRNAEAFALAAMCGSELPLMNFIVPGSLWIHGNKGNLEKTAKYINLVDKYHDTNWVQKLALDESLVLKLHAELAYDDIADFNPKFRGQDSNTPDELHHRFPKQTVIPPSQIKVFLSDLMAFCSQDIYSPLIQSCLAHLQMNYIHPFRTLNNSLGTLMGYIVYARRNYTQNIPVSIAVMSLDRIDNPIDSHKAAGDDPHEPYGLWINHAAKTLLSQVERLKQLEARFADIENRWLDSLQGLHRNNVCRTLAHDMLSMPMVSSRYIQQTYNRTAPSANNIIDTLVQRDIITPFNDNKRYRMFYAKEALDVYFNMFEDILPKGWTPPNYQVMEV